MTGQLFRKEVVEAQAERLHGEILLAQPVSLRIFTALLALILFAALTVLALGEYARTETVPGWLVPTAGLIKVIPARSGVVENVHVQAGATVTAGQSIATVNGELLGPDGRSTAERALATLTAQRARLADEIALTVERAAQRTATAATDQAALEAEQAALARQIALQQEIAGSARAAYKAVSGLIEEGLISRAESERRLQAVLTAEQQLEALFAASETLEADLKRLILAPSVIRTERDTAIARLEGQIAALDQQAELLAGGRRFIVTAPVAGRVTTLSLTPGSAIDPSRPAATVMPQDSLLEGQLFVPSRAAGFIEPGQRVRIAYEAFPRAQFGQFEAEIFQVSGTIQSPADLDVPLELSGPFYAVRVALAGQGIEAYGQSYPLQPGMLVTASIVLETRSFLDWLLDPIRAATREREARP